MPNKDHVSILQRGVTAWNQWRRDNPAITPDLSAGTFDHPFFPEVDLHGTNLSRTTFTRPALEGADLHHANLTGAHFIGAELRAANLSGAIVRDAHFLGAYLARANLSDADFQGTELAQATFIGADLTAANFTRADLKLAVLAACQCRSALFVDADLTDATLSGANLAGADFSGATLLGTSLVRANIDDATFTGCRIFGTSVWDVAGTPRNQNDLIITQPWEPVITADSLAIAQFLYLLLNNVAVRDVIDMVTSKVVLILGRFTPPRKAVLDGIRAALRTRNYLPVLFDFDKPMSRNITETVSTLAHLARFIVVDITEPQSVPQELQAVIPRLPSVPVQPLIAGDSLEYGMFGDFKSYPWVLPIHRYRSPGELLAEIEAKVIAPAEERRRSSTR